MIQKRKVGQNIVPSYSSPIVNYAQVEVADRRWD